jgi:hypothetical protein
VLVAAAAVGAALVGAARPVDAGGGLEAAVVGGGPLLDLDHAAPGGTGGGRLLVTNNSPVDGVLTVRLVHYADDDNGCEEPEREAGDATCGDGEGELGENLSLRIEEGGTVLFDGRATSLAQADTILDTRLARGESSELVFTYRFAEDAGSENQSDDIGFDVELTLVEEVEAIAAWHGPATTATTPVAAAPPTDVQPTASTGVLGSELVRSPSAVVPGTALPRTGGDPARLALGAGILLGVGSSLVLLDHRRAQRR